MTAADDQVRATLLPQGFALQYATLAWNVAGIAALATGYHPHHSVPGIWIAFMW